MFGIIPVSCAELESMFLNEFACMLTFAVFFVFELALDRCILSNLAPQCYQHRLQASQHWL